MSESSGGRLHAAVRRVPSPPLHPLEVEGAPRRRYLAALWLRLLSTAGTVTVTVALGLVAVALPSGALLTAVLLAVAPAAAAGWCARRAWAGLPVPGGPRPMPVTADRRFSLAAAVLLSLGALVASVHGPAGAFLAPMCGLGAALTAAASLRALAGRAAHPARQAPALLSATAVSWTAAATVGGLGASGLLASVVGVVVLLVLVHAALYAVRTLR